MHSHGFASFLSICPACRLEVKLRMLIFRGQVLQNGKKLSDYKVIASHVVA